ncbi:MAG TPA: AMP-binding protein [Solirubrobacteraceae bacterium]|nr:AMP-binding protein [Solirubrobacteraceae bacterium]
MSENLETMSMVAAWRMHAEERPDGPALTVSEHPTVSWGELAARTNRLARAYAELGVGEGDFVTIGLPTSVAFVESMVAALKLGAVPQPVSSRLPAGELAQIIELAQPRLVVGFDPAVHLDHQVLASNPPIDDHDDGPLPEAVAPAYKAPTSGGSTGRPKIILSGTPAVIPVVEGRPTPVGIPADSVVMFPSPLYHNMGVLGTLLGLSGGSHVVLQEHFDAELTLRLIDRHRVVSAWLVPTHMNRIWRLPAAVRESHDISSLAVLLHGGGPCPAELKRAWINWLGPDRIIEMYTATEAAAVTLCSGSEWLERPGTVGRCFMGEMAIFDEDGVPVAAGDLGTIWMRRPSGSDRTYSYIGEESEERDDGWDTAGDLGWMDDEGYLFLADRRTDMIVSGAANIYPAEVEAALAAHPSVIDCVVIGLPDGDLGQRVHAIVQTDADTLEEQALREHLAGRLVLYKTPRTYEFTALPLRDDAGKVRRSTLRDQRSR